MGTDSCQIWTLSFGTKKLKFHVVVEGVLSRGSEHPAVRVAKTWPNQVIYCPGWGVETGRCEPMADCCVEVGPGAVTGHLVLRAGMKV